jgi:uncharacterized protein
MTEEPIVAVRGEAFREVDPEIATFQVGVTARDRDRATTLARLSQRADAVRAVLDEHAGAIEKRETSGLVVQPERAPSKRPGERVIGYAGWMTIRVTVSDFTALGELLLRLADQEQTQVAGAWWSLRPGSPVHRELRTAAIADALERARDYAGAVGARLTGLIEIADAGMSSGPAPRVAYGRPMAMRSHAVDEAAPELEIDPQRQQVNAQIEARFTISTPTALAEPED